MKKFLIIIKKPAFLAPIIFAFVGVVVFLVVRPVFAQNVVAQAATAGISGIGDIVRIMAGSLIFLYVHFIGQLLLIIIKILVQVASYNDFVNSAVVLHGWSIVRDLSNMFFIIILLAIAFGTILGVEQLNWEKRLPKLLIFAVLINFTRVISGLIIDFGQVIMITFVNGFKDAAGGNFAELLGIRQLLEVSVPGQLPQLQRVAAGDIGGAAIDFIQVISAMIGAAIFATIAFIVVLLITMVLVYRMVMLWIYVTLSPVAFILGAFPQGESYYADWWKKMVSTVALGPVLAFFLWLTLLTVGQITIGTSTLSSTTDLGAPTATAITCGASEACQPDNVLKFIVGIGMLMGGLTVAQGLASSAGEGMGGLVGFAKKASTGVIKRLTGISTAQRAREAFAKKDMQAGGIGGALAKAGIYMQAGFKRVPFMGGVKAGAAVEKYQSDQIALRKKKMGSFRDQELLEMYKKKGGASYEKAAAMALLGERGAIKEWDEKTQTGFKKEEIDALKNVFGNDKAGLGQLIAAVKKSAPGLAYDLKNPAERAQFALDVRRGTARAENLDARHFEDPDGEAFVSGISAGQTSEQIQAFYNKLTADAQEQFEKQLKVLSAKAGATFDVKEAYANITGKDAEAFAGSPDERLKWIERRYRVRRDRFTGQTLQASRAAVQDEFVQMARSGKPVPSHLQGKIDEIRAVDALSQDLGGVEQRDQAQKAAVEQARQAREEAGVAAKEEKQREKSEKRYSREAYKDFDRYKSRPRTEIDNAVIQAEKMVTTFSSRPDKYPPERVNAQEQAVERLKKVREELKLADEIRDRKIEASAATTADEKNRIDKQIAELEKGVADWAKTT